MSSDTKLVWVDPPAGWMYGFPKIWDKEKHPDLEVWLVDKGYRQSPAHIRMWEATEEEASES